MQKATSLFFPSFYDATNGLFQSSYCVLQGFFSNTGKNIAVAIAILGANSFAILIAIFFPS